MVKKISRKSIKLAKIVYLRQAIKSGNDKKFIVSDQISGNYKPILRGRDVQKYFYKNPKRGEVYNAGGSRHSNVSVLEAISKIEKILNKKAIYAYVDNNRIRDHMWYISDVSKFKKHYPGWNFKYDIDQILEEICDQGHF